MRAALVRSVPFHSHITMHPNIIPLFEPVKAHACTDMQLTPEGAVLWMNHFDDLAPKPLSEAHRAVFLAQRAAQAAEEGF
jgi:hypothetical protein